MTWKDENPYGVVGVDRPRLRISMAAQLLQVGAVSSQPPNEKTV